MSQFSLSFSITIFLIDVIIHFFKSLIQSEKVHIKMITYTGQILKQPKKNEVIQAHNKKNRINIL